MKGKIQSELRSPVAWMQRIPQFTKQLVDFCPQCTDPSIKTISQHLITRSNRIRIIFFKVLDGIPKLTDFVFDILN